MSEALVTADRIRLFVAQEAAGESDGSPFGWLQRMCRVAVRFLPASGAGFGLMDGEGHGVAASSDHLSAAVEELQFVLGEGPCVDAYSSREPVLAHDLGEALDHRWPLYAPAARSRGVKAVFAFPLRVGNSCRGVMDVYRDHAGSLSRDALHGALVFAEVALTSVLDEYEDLVAMLGDQTVGTDDPLGHRLEVYQAVGMVMQQLGVTADEAMVRLRAHAYTQDRGLADVARDVLARKLTLARDDDRPDRPAFADSGKPGAHQ